MAEIKWIKLTTDMFDDEKIRIIESMPEADMVLVIWVKLLTLAGKKNMNGFIFLTENIPYTDETLSTIFNRPVNTIRLALDVFKKFNMIEYDGNNNLKITNWEKHQNIAELEKIRENNRLRVQKFREKQKQIEAPKKCNVTVTKCNTTDKNRLDKNNKIFTHWLNQNIYKHKKNTFESQIRTALKKYSLEEILTAITNYGIIVNGEEYYWSYKWTLGDFLKRGLDKFMDLDTAKENYRANGKSNKKKYGIV
jgi:predicted phage replisome organizer